MDLREREFVLVRAQTKTERGISRRHTDGLRGGGSLRDKHTHRVGNRVRRLYRADPIGRETE